MTKHLIAIVVSFLIFLTLSSPVSAHVLLTSGNIGAVVHINPDDDPIVGQPASFYLEFKDKTNRFQPELCDCKITVSKNGSEITTLSLFDSTNPNTPVFDFTFPEKNLYQLTITGSPKTPNAFDSFKLEHVIRVERTPTPQNSNANLVTSDPHFFQYIAILVAVIVFAGIFALNRRSQKTQAKKPTQKILSFILCLAILTPVLYAASHFNHHHHIISADHHSHPCCLSTDNFTPDTNIVTKIVLETYSTPSNPFHPTIVRTIIHSTTRAPPSA